MTAENQRHVDPNMAERIRSELSAIEREHGVKIVLAVESGSRAWGFPSQDSDDADAVFGMAHPKTVVLTTPNAEYNARYETMEEGELRHADHRFEWTRSEFVEWAQKTSAKFGYKVTFDAIGEIDPELGASTQMGVFTCI